MTRITTHTTIHRATTIKADSKNGVEGALKFEFTTDNWKDGCAEYCVFLGDQVLADRLATAINDVMKARKAELEAEITDEPANGCVRDNAQFGVGA